MKPAFLEVNDLRGGRNGYDPPLTLAPNQAVEAVNVDWYAGTLGRKRPGSAAVSTTGSGLAGALVNLIRHTPSADEKNAELWATDTNQAFGRYAAGAWSSVSPVDAIGAADQPVIGASLNGKLFLAYYSMKDRVHVWDGATLRRAGIEHPASAPTAANSVPAGAYPAVLRYYKQADCVQSGGSTIRRSELTASVSFTPDGAHDGVDVTKAASVAGENPTHWEVYGSADNINYYRLATVAIGTSVWKDTILTTDYSDYPLAQAVGLNIPMGAAKFLLCDENRLLGARSHQVASYASRVWWTPVFGAASGQGCADGERVIDTTTVKSYIDLDIADGGGITGMGGPLNGSPYIFKLSQTYKLVRTGKQSAAYRPVTISKTIGCIEHRTIVEGIDASGSPCLYFLALDGPRRISSDDGMQWLGNDIQDVWATLNLGATVVAHGVYYKTLHQVWWWIATGANATPDTLIVFDVRLGKTAVFGVQGGWSKFTGNLATQRCSVMFANTLGATVSLDLVPYCGSGGNLLNKVDASATSDSGVTYQAYVKTKPLPLAGLGKRCGVIDAQLMAKSATGVTVRVSVDRDFGTETRYVDVLLTPAGSETRVVKQVDDASMAGATTLQFQFGDSAAVASAWTLEGFVVKYRTEEDR